MGIVVACVCGSVATGPVEVGVPIGVANGVDDRQVVVGVIGSNASPSDRYRVNRVAGDLPESRVVRIITHPVAG